LPHAVYTIGHSNHRLGYFIELLSHNRITAVGDVRSQPLSRLHPHFSQNHLVAALKEAKISYVFLGEELGGRVADESCYKNGKVQYERVAQLQRYLRGIERVEQGIHNFRIALVCAEKEPLQCHRSILISRTLISRGLSVRHILGDGSIEEHDSAVSRLMSQLGLRAGMFESEEDLIALAYKMQGERIAFTRAVAKRQITENQ
jgi:uncharacterized protein (DUF488 family)